MPNPLQILNQIIKQDSADKVYPLLDDVVLAHIVHAWALLPVEWVPPEEIDWVPETEEEQLDLLWNYTKYDVNRLSVMTGLSCEQVLLTVARARYLRLIYPNGTISQMAKRLLSLKVAEELGRLRSTAMSGTSNVSVKGRLISKNR